jgi:hypothetical protein
VRTIDEHLRFLSLGRSLARKSEFSLTVLVPLVADKDHVALELLVLGTLAGTAHKNRVAEAFKN